MLRRTFLAAPLAAAAQPRRPNIVFILADDYGWRDTGYNGSTFYETPNLDRLAGSGIEFTNGYSASPVCTPTRAAIMTGKYPARLGLTSHLQGAHRLPHSKVLPPQFPLAMPLEETTIAELLRQRGYRTACVGKWHLGGTGFLPKDQGFDLSVGGDVAGSTSSFFYPKWKSKIPLDGSDGDYLTDRLTSIATGFIEENQRNPFFLYLPHFAVHTPIEGKPDLVTKYAAKSNPANPQNFADYAAMVESLDQSVGRVLDTLERLKLDNNTIVIFTSDNGGVTSREWKNRPVTSNLPLRSGKGNLYEGGIRVPLLVRWPGVTKPATKCEEPVLAVDYAPTLASIAGVKQTGPMDGTDITPLLKGKPRLARREIFWHYPHYSPQLGYPSAAVRQGGYKLIRFFEDDRTELYHLPTDIGESKNLAAAQPKLAATLNRRLTRWFQETGAKLPANNPNYDPARETMTGTPMGPVPEK
jgi:arylsulfatase A